MFTDFTDQMISAFSDFIFKQITLFNTPVEWIVLWLALPMVLFTVYFGFINVRVFPLTWKILAGRYANPNASGEVSQFQALATALSGTVGLGNIAGVAIAIAIGGPGATFWMIVIAFFAMSLKFAECTLGVKYRTIRPDGTVYGGPMYYLQRGLEAQGLPRLGKYLALAYGICALPLLLQIGQVNQAYSQISSVVGFEFPWIFGIGLALATGAVIIGGLQGITQVTSRLVPVMCGIYILAALVILVTHVTEIPAAFVAIFKGAFNPEGVMGGVVGVFVVGMRRAVYSTEAGVGSSTMIHAAAKTDEPVSEGLVALMEPFIDTVIISTMTALVIVVTGAYKIDGLNDIQMTSAAFASVISWFPYILAISVLLFAFSTIVSWSYYISRVWSFLFGYSATSQSIYRLVFCLAIIPGGVLTVQQAFDLIDSFFFLITIPNVIGLYLMAPQIKRDLQDYLSRVKSGEIKETT